MKIAVINRRNTWSGRFLFVGSLVLMLSGDRLLAEESDAGGRYIRYGFEVQNRTDQYVPVAELWVCAPLRESATQHAVEWDASHACQAHEDRLGNHLLQFVIRDIPPYGTSIVYVEATLQGGSGSNRTEPDPAIWLKSESLIEHEEKEFVRLAPVFPADMPETTARRIYDWVRAHLREAGYDGTDRGALHALIRQQGDCTEFAMLFTALCRREGIPARVMGGYVVERNAVLDPASYHNWAEFLVDGRWHLADPQRGVFGEDPDFHVATRVLGESDLPLGNFPRYQYSGEGIRVRMLP